MGGDGTGSHAARQGGKGTLFAAFHNTRTTDDWHNHEGRLKITANWDSSKRGTVSPWDSQLQPAQKGNEQRKSAEMHPQCRAAARTTCRWVLAGELASAARRPAGHTSGSHHAGQCRLPGTADGSAAAQPAGTVTQQEPLLLSACFSGRRRCTTLLLPRAAWGMSTWGQPDAGSPHPARAGCQGPRSSLCLPLSSLPLPRGGAASRGGLLLRRFKGEQLVPARSIPGWPAPHSPPRWQPERELHQAAPAANNYVLSKSMGYNWTIKISLSSWLRVPQPAACWGRPQPAATETTSRPSTGSGDRVHGAGMVQAGGTRIVAATHIQHRRHLCGPVKHCAKAGRCPYRDPGDEDVQASSF